MFRAQGSATKGRERVLNLAHSSLIILTLGLGIKETLNGLHRQIRMHVGILDLQHVTSLQLEGRACSLPFLPL